MKIRTTVVCLPVRDLEKTLTFYKDGLGFLNAQIEDGIITLELPNLSLFLMGKDAFETYTKQVSQDVHFPENNTASAILSCAIDTKEEVDTILAKVPQYGGVVPKEAAVNEKYGGYIGYFFDPNGHLWELVFPKSSSKNI